MMKQIILLLVLLVCMNTYSQSDLPIPDHIVILIYENKAYDQIIGSSSAPYINELATNSNSALFTNSYGIEHPSQPNYIDFYSGCNQGVTHNNIPEGQPFTTPNLGSQLLNSGRTFITYSEDLPEVGFNGMESGYYARRHNPAANWMGTGENQIPPETNQPFSAFPTSDFSLLPDVCFVIPNVMNDMHDGSISTGDEWYYIHLSDYVEWAQTNNSLFILTFDEDNYNNGNHITTIFSGPMMNGGAYSDSINHYSVLRTIEELYGLSYICNADSVNTINNCWNITGTNNIDRKSIVLYPNPATGAFLIHVPFVLYDTQMKISIFNSNGKLVWQRELHSNDNNITLENLNSGMYFYQLVSGHEILKSDKLIILD